MHKKIAGQVGIVGLGLIGGSLALAIKKARPGEFRIRGYTRTAANAAKALEMGVVEEVVDNPVSAVVGADLVVLATPIMSIGAMFREIAEGLSRGAIVTDVASTKTFVMRWAEEYLPHGVDFVGGHPMAGKEVFGVGAADVDLFNGCTYCLVQGERTSAKSLKGMVDLVQGIGARPLVIDAAKHDDFVAAVSHLPFFVSAALVSATSNNPNWSEMSRLAAGGYRDATRLASQSPEMGLDMCLTNQDNLLRWIDSFIRELGHFRDSIASDPKAVEKMLVAARKAREVWLEERRR